MKTYSIFPLAEDHFEERCADMVRQSRERIADTPLLLVDLMPDGRPVFDKAAACAPLFSRYRARLAADGVIPGFLVQTTLGHESPVNEPTDMQLVVRATDGSAENAYCPMDPLLQSYFRESMTTLAACHPSAIMIDDDFRLSARFCRGCVCDRHIDRFNRRAGTGFDRAGLIRYLSEHGDEDPLVRLFEQTQTETLVDLARILREGIDRADPAVQGVVCCNFLCRESQQVAPVIAGAGRPVVVRAANGIYSPPSPLNLSDTMRRAAIARQIFRGVADVLISETDCIQYNRYAKSASYLHSHYLGSLLEGMRGAKHWLTRLSEYSPESGEAYRRILAENAGLYERAAALSDGLQWLGCRVPLPKRLPTRSRAGHFVAAFLERVGIPFYFSAEPGGAVCANGPIAEWFSREELDALFADSLFLSSDAAESLIAAGFGDRLGVAVREWTGETPGGEQLDETSSCGCQMGMKELVPTAPRTETDTAVFHRSGSGARPLFPGVTVFPQGDKLRVVFCGTPKAQHTYTEAFSFLNAARKRQFIRLLSRCGQLPVYYDGDGQVMLRAGRLPDGRMLIWFLNTGDDPLPDVPLVFERPVRSVVRLNARGEEIAEETETGEGRTVIRCPAPHMQPLIFLAIPNETMYNNL